MFQRSAIVACFVLALGACANRPALDQPRSIEDACERLVARAWADWRTGGGLRQALDATPRGSDHICIAVVDWFTEVDAIEPSVLESELRLLVTREPRCAYASRAAMRAALFEMSIRGPGDADPERPEDLFLPALRSAYADALRTGGCAVDVAARGRLSLRDGALQLDFEILEVARGHVYAVRARQPLFELVDQLAD